MSFSSQRWRTVCVFSWGRRPHEARSEGWEGLHCPIAKHDLYHFPIEGASRILPSKLIKSLPLCLTECLNSPNQSLHLKPEGTSPWHGAMATWRAGKKTWSTAMVTKISDGTEKQAVQCKIWTKFGVAVNSQGHSWCWFYCGTDRS